MATGLSVASSSNLGSGQKILIAEAKQAYEAAAPDPDLIDQHRIPQGHKQWDILTYARLTSASALSEGVDLSSSQQLVAASLSITPTEHGVIATLSNRLVRRQGDTNVVSSAGKMLANSLRRRQALDVVSLYDGFSKSHPGSGALDIITFRGAVAYLLTDNDAGYGPAPLPLHAALHIEQISDIIIEITDTAPRGTTSGFTDELLQRWWKGSDRLYGVQIFHSGIIERASDSTAKGGLFAKEALAMVMANNADVTEQQDHSLRAVEYGIFQEWGEGERADVHGVEVHSDAAATI
jgi:hypothetical protein